eukprot:IDg4120t1
MFRTEICTRAGTSVPTGKNSTAYELSELASLHDSVRHAYGQNVVPSFLPPAPFHTYTRLSEVQTVALEAQY